jgi:hypothetical protein
VSKGFGSLAHNVNPAWEFASVKAFRLQCLKAARNML